MVEFNDTHTHAEVLARIDKGIGRWVLCAVNFSKHGREGKRFGLLDSRSTLLIENALEVRADDFWVGGK